MDLVNLNTGNQLEKGKESYKDENIFIPDPKKGKNGVYKAGVRFIPWWKDPQNSMLRKRQAILTHPYTKEKMFVECPSTVNQPSILWDLDTLLYGKKKAKVDLQIVEEIYKNFNRYLNVYAPIYIIKDLQDASLNGKIKLYPFGHTILKQIKSLLEPESLGMGAVTPIDPFNLLNGKDYHVIVSQKSKSYKNYEQCKFVDNTSPLTFMYNGQPITVTAELLQETAKNDDSVLGKFLKENTPDMDAYKFKPWTPDIRDKVADYIIAIVQYPSIMQELLTSTKDQETKNLIIAKLKEREAMVAGMSGTGIPQSTAPVVNTPINTPISNPPSNAGGLNLGTSQPVNEEKPFVFDNTPDDDLSTPAAPITNQQQTSNTPVSNDLEADLNSVSGDDLSTPVTQQQVETKNAEAPVVGNENTGNLMEDANFKNMLEQL